MLYLTEVNCFGPITAYRVRNKDTGYYRDYSEKFFLDNFVQYDDRSVTIKLKKGQVYERTSFSDLFIIGNRYKVLSVVGDSSAVMVDKLLELNITSPTIHYNHWLLVDNARSK